MRSNIDFQALIDLCNINEARPQEGFNLVFWSCNTESCLIGGWYLATEDEKIRCYRMTNELFFSHEAISERFGISISESQYLFHSSDPLHHEDGTTNYYSCNTEILNRDKFDKEAAILRVRKFIYYHLRKQEFCIDERGITNKSREAGDVRFDEQILELVH
jgi:hypothetical protein